MGSPRVGHDWATEHGHFPYLQGMYNLVGWDGGSLSMKANNMRKIMLGSSHTKILGDPVKEWGNCDTEWNDWVTDWERMWIGLCVLGVREWGKQVSLCEVYNITLKDGWNSNRWTHENKYQPRSQHEQIHECKTVSGVFKEGPIFLYGWCREVTGNIAGQESRTRW